MITFISITVAILYVSFNFVTAKFMSGKEMKQDFIDGQCLVGKIATNIFYAPAWILKGVRFIVFATIK